MQARRPKHPLVSISDPGFRVSRQVALGCQERGILDKYYTSYFFHQDSLGTRAAKLLPGRFQHRVMRNLSKRSLNTLEPRSVQTLPRFETVGRAKVAASEFLRLS